jgi:membrane protease YdiL (CAAX protease family)
MFPSRSTLIRFPFATFTVLACGFAWIFQIAEALGGPPGQGQFPLGPIIAALLVAAGRGRSGLREWWRHLSTFRTAPGWYLLALLGPVVIVGAAVLVNALFGAPLPSADQLRGVTTLGPTFLVMVIAVGIGEEAGWTAFAAPWLLERRRFITAWLTLATVRTIWHLPLMLNGDLSLTLGIGGNFAFQFLLLWLFQRTRVWWLAAVWHGTLNTVGGQFLFRMVEGADQDRLGLLMVAGYAIAAVAVGVIDRRRLETGSTNAPDGTGARG